MVLAAKNQCLFQMSVFEQGMSTCALTVQPAGMKPSSSVDGCCMLTGRMLLNCLRKAFYCDLIGCTAKDTSGEVIGVVTEVLQPGANDIYVIAAQGGTWLVPALKKVVLEVDTAQKTMTLDTALFPEVAVFEN